MQMSKRKSLVKWRKIDKLVSQMGNHGMFLRTLTSHNTEVLNARGFIAMDDEDLAVTTSLLNNKFVTVSSVGATKLKRVKAHKLIVIALNVDFVVQNYLAPFNLLNKRWT